MFEREEGEKLLKAWNSEDRAIEWQKSKFYGEFLHSKGVMCAEMSFIGNATTAFKTGDHMVLRSAFWEFSLVIS